MSTPMDASTVWLIMLGLGAGTFLMRLSFIHLAGRLPMPTRLSRTLRFVPAAVLAALVVPAILRWTPGGEALTGDDLPRLAAGLAAAVVAWTTRSVLATLGVGMGLLWGLTALF